MWQWRQFLPLWQPPCFQNQAHGRHSPTPCNTEPCDGRIGESIGSTRGSASNGGIGMPSTGENFKRVDVQAKVLSAATSSFKCFACGATGSDRVFLICGPHFANFLDLSSPSGQIWQCRHSSPFWQPCGFQNHAQGRHLPVPSCSAEPTEGNFFTGITGTSSELTTSQQCTSGGASCLCCSPCWFVFSISDSPSCPNITARLVISTCCSRER